MTHDAWMIAITGVSGATLLLMCIGRKRLREIRDRIGMHIYRWMVISPAHVNTDDCSCDSCDPFAGHVASLPEGITTPADRYAMDEYLARGTERILDAIRVNEDVIEEKEAEIAATNAVIANLSSLDDYRMSLEDRVTFAGLTGMFHAPDVASDADRP